MEIKKKISKRIPLEKKKEKNSGKERVVLNFWRWNFRHQRDGSVLEVEVETSPETLVIPHELMEGLSNLCESFVGTDVHSFLCMRPQLVYIPVHPSPFHDTHRSGE